MDVDENFFAPSLEEIRENGEGDSQELKFVGSNKTSPTESKSADFHTVITELRADQVRWFYKRPEIDKFWMPFCGRDSLIMEFKYRRVHDVPICEHTVDALSSIICSHDNLTVLGGLYKFVPTNFEISPIYWKGDTLDIKRGTWTVETKKGQLYQPIEGELAEKIEKEHLRVFRGQNIPSYELFDRGQKKPVVTKLETENCEIVWHSVVNVELWGKGRASKMLRYLNIYSSAGVSILKRGYSELARVEDCARRVDHLIFVTHGIGQVTDAQRIVRNTDTLRDIADAQLDKHFPELETRPIFIPVQWRSSLKLDQGAIDRITIPEGRSFRLALNSSLLDVMYYQSTIYRTEILEALAGILNELHGQFMSYNPEFQGKISIYAHSLGAVICYDILTGWSPISLYDDFVTAAIANRIRESNEAEKSVLSQLSDARDKIHQLEGGRNSLFLPKNARISFAVENLFCVGSPLPAFLVLRGENHNWKLPENANAKRLVNLYHPLDPVAYRFEPLVSETYRYLAPVRVHAFDKAILSGAYDLETPQLDDKIYDSSAPGGKVKLKKVDKKKWKKKKKNKKEEEEKELENSSLEEEEQEMDEEEDAKSAASSGGSGGRALDEDAVSLSSAAKIGEETEEKTRRRSGFGWLSSFRRNASSPTISSKERAAELGLDVAKIDLEHGQDKFVCPVLEEEEESEAEKRKSRRLSLDAEVTLAEIKEEMKSENAGLKRRLDFCLKRSSNSLLPAYVDMFRSHFTYWTHQDGIMFLLGELYGQKKKSDEKST